MADYSNANANFTPSTSQDNWALDPSTNSVVAKVKYISWGGAGTTSTGYQTRWYRPTTIGSGSFTAVGAVNNSNYGTTALMRFGTFATALTPPTAPGALFYIDWNVLGGGGILVLPIGSEWLAASAGTAAVNGQIGCRNISGTDANLSSYSVQWQE